MRAVSLAAARGITWLIFVEDLHVDFRNTGHFRNLIKVIAGELVDEDDAFMVRSSGPSNLRVERTSDRARLAAAARTATGNGLKPSDIIRSPQRADGPSEVRFRAAVAFAAAKEMLDASERLDGTPAELIYVSNGYHIDVAPGPDATMETTGFSAPTRSISAARVRDQFWDLTATARRANVRIFSIDPRTLPGAPKEQGWDPVAWHDHRTTTQGTLSQMSEAIGGFAVLDAGDVVAAVRQIRQTVAGFPVKP